MGFTIGRVGFGEEPVKTQLIEINFDNTRQAKFPKTVIFALDIADGILKLQKNSPRKCLRKEEA